MLANPCCCGPTGCTRVFDPGGPCTLPGETLYYTRTGGLAVTGGPFALTFGSNPSWRGWYGLVPVPTTAAHVWNCAGSYAAGTFNVLLRLTCDPLFDNGITFQQIILSATNAPNTQLSIGQVVVPDDGAPYLERTCATGPNVLWTVACTNIQLFSCEALNVRCVMPAVPNPSGFPAYAVIDGRITL